MKHIRNPRRPGGFTLVELLIALLIIGEISTFTIPKVINAQQDGRKKTILREMFATYSGVLAEGVVTNGLDQGGGNYVFNDYVAPKLNAVKMCTQAITQGCWTGSDCIQAPNGGGGQVFSNGAYTCGLFTGTSAQNADNFWIDWNGDAGPNLEGDDRIRLTACFNQSCPGGQRAGTIVSYNSAQSQSLFDWVFQ